MDTLAATSTSPPGVEHEPTEVSVADSRAPEEPGGTSSSTDGVALPSASGDSLGRYLVLSKLGAGAMGVVLAAYDPQLDRKVALKLLKSRSGSRSAAQSRLRREAQALAKLAHPNVVAVYDVGIHDDRVFVAMEFVAGQTLGDWMGAAEGPRPWREVVEVFTAAGRGLAAAHGAGLVHRDFKPDNVMIGEDGRVRVMDFGLARPDLGASQTGEIDMAALVGRLTQTGAMVGTPAYMSHEQFVAAEVDARTDQFSFCVALYEALYGARPFRGESIDQLLRTIEAGAIAEAPQGAQVPGWIRAAIVRGLSKAPDARWPTMEDLLAALADDPAQRRRKWIRGGGVLGLVAAAATLGWALAPTPPSVEGETCDSFVSTIDGRWNADRSRALAEQIARRDAAAAAGLVAELDRLAQSWRSAASERCQGTLAPARDSRDRLCMQTWLARFDRTVGLLAEANADQLGAAPDLLARLVPVAGDYCAIQPSREVDPEVAEHAEIAREAAVIGDFERGRVAAEQAVARAGALAGQDEHTLELAEAHAALGEVLAFASEEARALEQLGLAQAHARSTMYHRLDLDVLLLRVKLEAMLGAEAVAQTLLEQAGPLTSLARLGPRDPRRAEVLEARGFFERVRGNFGLAIEHHRQSRLLFEAAGLPTLAAKAVYNVGTNHYLAEETELAKRSFGEARELYEATGAGPSYRNLVDIDYMLGSMAYTHDDPAGLEHFERVARHGSTAKKLAAMGLAIGLAYNLGDSDAGAAWRDRALALLEQSSDAPLDVVVDVELAAAVTLLLDGDDARGEQMMLAAERDANALDGGLEQRALIQGQLIEWLIQQGRCGEALRRIDALDTLIAAPGADELGLAELQTSLREQPCELASANEPHTNTARSNP